MKKVLLVLITLAFATLSFAQAPTNAPQFQVSLNFFGSQPYAQSSAISTAFTSQFTANDSLRADLIAMPGAGYSGYFGGDQYNLCGIKVLENVLSGTSINCGKFSPYVNGAVGLGRISSQNNPTVQSVAGLVRVGANYDPTGSGVFTLNLFEAGWGDFGPSITGQTNHGFFYQSGVSVGLGNNPVATAAKKVYSGNAKAANKKKLDKLNDRLRVLQASN